MSGVKGLVRSIPTFPVDLGRGFGLQMCDLDRDDLAVAAWFHTEMQDRPGEGTDPHCNLGCLGIVAATLQPKLLRELGNPNDSKQGVWNSCDADTKVKDHTLPEIARPNNDTLNISCLPDLRKDPLILEMPAFDSDYGSLMVTGHDHYVNVPMATRLGDFKKPETMLFYTARRWRAVRCHRQRQEQEGGETGCRPGGGCRRRIRRLSERSDLQARLRRLHGRSLTPTKTCSYQFKGASHVQTTSRCHGGCCARRICP